MSVFLPSHNVYGREFDSKARLHYDEVRTCLGLLVRCIYVCVYVTMRRRQTHSTGVGYLYHAGGHYRHYDLQL